MYSTTATRDGKVRERTSTHEPPDSIRCRRDVKMMVNMMLSEAMEALDSCKPREAIENAGHAQSAAFIVAQAPAVAQGLGLTSLGYTALHQYDDAVRYAAAAVAVCGERFNMKDYGISLGGAATIDVSIPGMRETVYPPKVQAFCEAEAYKALGNAHSAVLFHRKAIEAFSKGIDALAALNAPGALLEYTQAALEYNLANQYFKEQLYDAASHHYSQSEYLASKIGDQSQLDLIRTARAMMEGGDSIELNTQMAADEQSPALIRIASMRNLVNMTNSSQSSRVEWFEKYQVLQEQLCVTPVNAECPICLEGFGGDDTQGGMHLTMCNHAFHTNCFRNAAKRASPEVGFQCAHCNTFVSRLLSVVIEDSDEEDEDAPELVTPHN